MTQADILVIGAGVAGLSAAARLSKLGQVIVLEAEAAAGYHASGRSAALFEQNYGAPSVVALSKASAEAHQPYLSPRGFMLLARDGEDESFTADCAALKCPEISPKEAKAHVPILNDAVTRAAYHADAYDIDTDLMLQNFARTLRGNGGSIVTSAPVNEITRKGGQWEVHAAGTVYHAATLVNAAGAWADEIATRAGITPLGLVPHRRSMARIPAPGGHDTSGWPIFFGVGESWYAKPDAGALLVSPADEDVCTAHDAYADDMVLAEGLDRYAQHVTPPVTRLLSSWAGLRTFAPDKTLVLGRDVAVPNFVWCAGQGGYGFQTAPAAAQLICDIVNGATPALEPAVCAALAPARLTT